MGTHHRLTEGRSQKAAGLAHAHAGFAGPRSVHQSGIATWGSRRLQVRHMVGALVAVGSGKMGLADISRRLELGSSEAPGAPCGSADAAGRGHWLRPHAGFLVAAC
jgi:hypothetical protein